MKHFIHTRITFDSATQNDIVGPTCQQEMTVAAAVIRRPGVENALAIKDCRALDVEQAISERALRHANGINDDVLLRLERGGVDEADLHRVAITLVRLAQWQFSGRRVSAADIAAVHPSASLLVRQYGGLAALLRVRPCGIHGTEAMPDGAIS